MGKFRSVPNPEVSQAQYTKACEDWLSSPPIVDLRSKLGPKLAKAYRAVTPGMIEAVLPFACNIMEAGEKTCVLQAAKLETALAECMRLSSVFCNGSSREKLAYDATCHLQSCFAMLRYLKAEEGGIGGKRQYPKSGGFRRRVHSGMWEKLVVILDKMVATTRAPVPEDDGDDLVDEHTEPTRPSTALDEQGFPTIFKQYLAGSPSPEPKRPVASGIFDEDGFPFFDGDSSCPSPVLTPVTGIAATPVTPSSRKRKKQIVAARSSKKRVKDSIDTPYLAVHLAFSDKPNLRAELRGVMIDGDGKRVRRHILTLTHVAHGPKYQERAAMIRDRIVADKLNKHDAIKLRDDICGDSGP